MASSLAPARIGKLLKIFQQTPGGNGLQDITSVEKGRELRKLEVLPRTSRTINN